MFLRGAFFQTPRSVAGLAIASDRETRRCCHSGGESPSMTLSGSLDTGAELGELLSPQALTKVSQDCGAGSSQECECQSGRILCINRSKNRKIIIKLLLPYPTCCQMLGNSADAVSLDVLSHVLVAVLRQAKVWPRWRSLSCPHGPRHFAELLTSCPPEVTAMVSSRHLRRAVRRPRK